MPRTVIIDGGDTPFMQRQAPHLDSLLRQVRRRLFVAKILESVGRFEWGCVIIALVLAIGGLIRGADALASVMMCLGTGVILGVGFSISKRPTPLAAASLIDHQLQTQDLLSTVVSLPLVHPADAWQTTVIALSEQRCCTISSQDLTIWRWPWRWWGTLSLGIVLSIVLAVLSVSRSPAPVGQTAAGGIAQLLVANQPKPTRLKVTEQIMGERSAVRQGAVREAGNLDADDSSQDQTAASDRNTQPANLRPNEGSHAEAGITGNSTGVGSSRTVVPPAAPLARSVLPNGELTTRKTGNQTDIHGSGTSGSSATGDVTSTSPAGSSAGSNGNHRQIMPWQASEAIEGSNGSMGIRGRHLPANYRTLVSEYFRAD